MFSFFFFLLLLFCLVYRKCALSWDPNPVCPCPSQQIQLGLGFNTTPHLRHRRDCDDTSFSQEVACLNGKTSQADQ
ncbi:hypothetical protein BDF14DRAFT_1849077 [Spinellus fusiger]|nr:hypothetical protein BDF14DRAFT_1849077 [Spinellus fusiger]